MMYEISNKNSRFTYRGTPEKELKRKREKFNKLTSPQNTKVLKHTLIKLLKWPLKMCGHWKTDTCKCVLILINCPVKILPFKLRHPPPPQKKPNKTSTKILYYTHSNTQIFNFDIQKIRAYISRIIQRIAPKLKYVFGGQVI